jgi:hypothetical protein
LDTSLQRKTTFAHDQLHIHHSKATKEKDVIGKHESGDPLLLCVSGFTRLTAALYCLLRKDTYTKSYYKRLLAKVEPESGKTEKKQEYLEAFVHYQ